MIQEHFLNLPDKYKILESAQIEPTSATDPDELYRMEIREHTGQTARFDVVFYPSEVEIQSVGGVRIGSIDPNSVDSADELQARLSPLEPHIKSSDGR